MSTVCETAFFRRVQNGDLRVGIRKKESRFSNADVVDIGYRSPVGDPVEETTEILFVHVHDPGKVMQIDLFHVVCLNIDHQLFQRCDPGILRLERVDEKAFLINGRKDRQDSCFDPELRPWRVQKQLIAVRFSKGIENSEKIPEFSFQFRKTCIFAGDHSRKSQSSLYQRIDQTPGAFIHAGGRENLRVKYQGMLGIWMTAADGVKLFALYKTEGLFPDLKAVGIDMKVIRAFFKVKQFKGVVPVRFYGKDRIRSWQGTDSLIHRTGEAYGSLDPGFLQGGILPGPAHPFRIVTRAS